MTEARGPIGHGEVAVATALLPALDAALTERYGATPLADADPARVRVLVTSGGAGADAATIARLPALALIAVFGVGYDKVDVGAAAARGIAVTHTPDVLTDDVADLAVGLLHAAARGIPAGDRFVREGRWARGEGVRFGHRVTGRRVGIVGLGRIGRAIADRLAPAAGAIAYHNRRPVPGCAYPYHADATALAAASDVLILSASSRAGDPPVVTRAVLDALGPDGIFVNVARGGMVDEPALTASLAERRILAAGLDVFAHEPNVPAALLALDNVVLLPHVGSATAHSRGAMADLVLANIAAFGADAPLPSAVPNPEG